MSSITYLSALLLVPKLRLLECDDSCNIATSSASFTDNTNVELFLHRTNEESRVPIIGTISDFLKEDCSLFTILTICSLGHGAEIVYYLWVTSKPFLLWRS